MRNAPTQGPMTAWQLREVLARANNNQHDKAADWGTPGTSTYYKAWLWVTANTCQLDYIPGRGFWEPWELESITRTINQVQDLVALDDFPKPA